MRLYDLLVTKRDEVMGRWKELVRGTLAPNAIPSAELLDHLPQFVDEIIAALRSTRASAAMAIEDGTTAADHGTQRLRLGFSLDAVVREYGALRDALIATAVDAGHEPTRAELQLIFDCTITGIAHAVSEYTFQRDAELRRQANEHFAFIAHELRNPLASAAMAFQQLKEAGVLPERRAITILERGILRTVELVDQTLQTSRAASGIELRRQPTTLAALFADAELGALPEAEAKGVALHVEPAGDEAIEVDIRLMGSAIGNLLRNAVRYSTGGTVDLRGRVVNERAIIEIEDCCGGLEPGKVESLFAPFLRVDQTQTGFGLGLAIAKQAIEAHGGAIRVQNLPTKGCIFIVEVPVSDPTPP
ncbi:MAG: sensor histidine kinase [Kofleriaceae bacterium]